VLLLLLDCKYTTADCTTTVMGQETGL